MLMTKTEGPMPELATNVGKKNSFEPIVTGPLAASVHA